MLVTPGTEKSKGSILKPAFDMKGTKKEPKQQSTCIPILCFDASAASSEMLSMIPSGKLGAEPTSAIVLALMARFVALRSACLVIGSTGTDLRVILKYEEAFSNAAWAELGTTSSGLVMPLVSRAQLRLHVKFR